MNPQQVMKLQAELLARGLYNGEIDGNMGKLTRRAIQSLPPGELDRILAPPPPPTARVPLTADEIGLERARLEAQRAKDNAEAKQKDPSSMAMKLGVELAPLIGGAAAGHMWGERNNRKYDKKIATFKDDAAILRSDAKGVFKELGGRTNKGKRAAQVAAAFGDAAREMKNFPKTGKLGVIMGASPFLGEGIYARYRSGIEENPEKRDVWDKASQFGFSAGLGQVGTELWNRYSTPPVNPSALAMAEGLGNAGKMAAKENISSAGRVAQALKGTAGKLGAAGLGFGAGMMAGAPAAEAAGLQGDSAAAAGVGAGALGAGAIAAPVVRRIAGALLGPAAAALTANDAYNLVKYMIEQERASPTPDATKYNQMNVSP